jgi:membrane protein
MSKALRFISRDETKVGFLASQWINFRLLFISSLLLVVYFYFTYGLVLSERFLFRTFKFGFFRSYSVFFIGLVAFVLITSLFVYYYANITRFRTQLRDNLPGAFLASFFVTLISFGFNFYLKLKNVGVNYSFAYELLSKMVVLMLYTYINSTFFIWGFVWNQILLEEKNKKKGIKS